ncbi:MAG: hypothetical protein ACE5G0_16730 [Rhodothermales bacterium]
MALAIVPIGRTMAVSMASIPATTAIPPIMAGSGDSWPGLEEGVSSARVVAPSVAVG